MERDSAGNYQLGRKLLKLAGRVRRGIDIREEARDIMRELRDHVGKTVNLTVREGGRGDLCGAHQCPAHDAVEQVVGSRAPLHVTAVGKLLHEVHRVSAEHFAFDNQEAEGGLSVSAPIERRSDAWIPLVQEAARRISDRLGYFAGRG